MPVMAGSVFSNASVIPLGTMADTPTRGHKQDSPVISSPPKMAAPFGANAGISIANKNPLLSTGSPVETNSVRTNGSSPIYTHPGGLMRNSPTTAMHSFSAIPTYSQYPPVHLMNNGRFPVTTPHIQMYPGQMVPQTAEAEPPKPWPKLDNSWYMQNIPLQQPQVYLPSMSNLGTISNQSLGSQCQEATKIQHSNLTMTNQALSLFNQLSSDSQFGKPTKSSR